MALTDTAFEPVAIVYSQPETAVMLSMFEFYGIPAYAVGFGHARVHWPLALALGGIVVRVHPDLLDDARELLADVATRPAAMRPRFIANPVIRLLAYLLMFGFVVGLPTRSPSTFLLDRRRPTDA
jgi:hypothetical protein